MHIELTPDEAAFLLDRTKHVAQVCRLLDKHRTVTKMVPIYGAHIAMLQGLAAKLEAVSASNPPTVQPPNFTTRNPEAPPTTTLSSDWSDVKGI